MKNKGYTYSPKQAIKQQAHSYRLTSEKEWNEAFWAGFVACMNFSLTVLYECGDWEKEHLESYVTAMKEMMEAFNKNPAETVEHIKAMADASDIRFVLPKVET